MDTAIKKKITTFTIMVFGLIALNYLGNKVPTLYFWFGQSIESNLHNLNQSDINLPSSSELFGYEVCNGQEGEYQLMVSSVFSDFLSEMPKAEMETRKQLWMRNSLIHNHVFTAEEDIRILGHITARKSLEAALIRSKITDPEKLKCLKHGFRVAMMDLNELTPYDFGVKYYINSQAKTFSSLYRSDSEDVYYNHSIIDGIISFITSSHTVYIKAPSPEIPLTEPELKGLKINQVTGLMPTNP